VKRHDVAIIGGGIAGATLAAEIASHASVLLLEGEEVAGYHATGRSAAFWSETYGGPAIQPLTTASGEALRAGGYLSALGALHIGRVDDAAATDAFLAEFEGTGVPLESVDPRGFIPGLRHAWTLGVLEPSCAYIDVARLHADALGSVRRAGADIRTAARFDGAVREGGAWRFGDFAAEVIVNAAGAWADPVAASAGVTPIGIAPFRRTMAQIRTDPAAPEGMPHVAHIGGDFYFKPEPGGRLWLSPHDEIPTDAGDAQPEELDIAIAIDRFEHCVDWRVAAVERKWAGLRTFAPDRSPVYGFDAVTPGFFWFAGQGGFGIQTAPAAAQIGAALLLGATAAPAVAAIDVERYSPRRFSR
jgi:D-arginine dehydrogenase